MPYTDTDPIFKAIQKTKTYKSMDFACYVQKPAWMTRHLGLRGDKLDVFAVVWSMTVNGNDAWYYGGNNFIADILGKYGPSRKCVRRALNNLVKAGYLKRMPRKRPTDDKVVLCYQPDTEGIIKAIEENDHPGDRGPRGGGDVDADDYEYEIDGVPWTAEEDDGAETMTEASSMTTSAVIDEDGTICEAVSRDTDKEEPTATMPASVPEKTTPREQNVRTTESRGAGREQKQIQNGTKHVDMGTISPHIINNKKYSNPSPITLPHEAPRTGGESNTDSAPSTGEGEGEGIGFKDSEKSNSASAAATFNRCMDAAVNKNRASDARLAFNDLTRVGYEPREIEGAWTRYQQNLRATGREDRFFTNFFSWLTECGSNGARALMDRTRAERRKKADTGGNAEHVRFITGRNGAQNHVLAFTSSGGWVILPNVDGDASYEEKLAAYRKVAA